MSATFRIRDLLSSKAKQNIRDILYFPNSIRYRLYCSLKGILIGANPRFYGSPRIYLNNRRALSIGDNFTAVSDWRRNSMGVNQPVTIKILTPSASIRIGNNVGISGTSIAARESITIGNNVLIGTGCLITDNDAHPIPYIDRRNNEAPKSKPVAIGSDVFLGARSIILKGVSIGDRSVIGAGSIVVRDVPPDTIYSGNPATKIADLNERLNDK